MFPFPNARFVLCRSLDLDGNGNGKRGNLFPPPLSLATSPTSSRIDNWKDSESPWAPGETNASSQNGYVQNTTICFAYPLRCSLEWQEICRPLKRFPPAIPASPKGINPEMPRRNQFPENGFRCFRGAQQVRIVSNKPGKSEMAEQSSAPAIVRFHSMKPFFIAFQAFYPPPPLFSCGIYYISPLLMFGTFDIERIGSCTALIFPLVETRTFSNPPPFPITELPLTPIQIPPFSPSSVRCVALHSRVHPR